MEHRNIVSLALFATLFAAPLAHARDEIVPSATPISGAQVVAEPNQTTPVVEPEVAPLKERGKNITVSEIAKAFQGDGRPSAYQASVLFFGEDLTQRAAKALGIRDPEAELVVSEWLQAYEKLDTRHLNNIEGWRQGIANVLSGTVQSPHAGTGEKVYSAIPVPEAWVNLLTKEAKLSAEAMAKVPEQTPDTRTYANTPDLGPDPNFKESFGQQPPTLTDAQLRKQEDALYKKLGKKRPEPKKLVKKITPVKTVGPNSYRMDGKGNVTDERGTYMFTYNKTTKEFFWKDQKIPNVPVQYNAIVEKLGTAVVPAPAPAPKAPEPKQPKTIEAPSPLPVDPAKR